MDLNCSPLRRWCVNAVPGALIVALVLFSTGCSGPPRGRILSPLGWTDPIDWTADDLGRDIAMRTLQETDEASFHVVRLEGSERPHVHDRSDLTVFVLRGRVEMHLGSKERIVNPGDVIQVPRGTPHWARNVHPEASEAYVIFTPPTDGRDHRPVEP